MIRITSSVFSNMCELPWTSNSRTSQDDASAEIDGESFVVVQLYEQFTGYLMGEECKDLSREMRFKFAEFFSWVVFYLSDLSFSEDFEKIDPSQVFDHAAECFRKHMSQQLNSVDVSWAKASFSTGFDFGNFVCAERRKREICNHVEVDQDNPIVGHLYKQYAEYLRGEKYKGFSREMRFEFAEFFSWVVFYLSDPSFSEEGFEKIDPSRFFGYATKCFRSPGSWLCNSVDVSWAKSNFLTSLSDFVHSEKGMSDTLES